MPGTIKKQPPDDASPADPNDAGAMCSVAASGSTAESLHRSIEAIPGSCMVASASVGISGVCSVEGHVGVERGLFPIELIARNAAKKDVDKPKDLTSTNIGTNITDRAVGNPPTHGVSESTMTLPDNLLHP